VNSVWQLANQTTSANEIINDSIVPGTTVKDALGNLYIFSETAGVITPITAGAIVDLLTGYLKANKIIPSSGDEVQIGEDNEDSVIVGTNSLGEEIIKLNTAGDSFINTPLAIGGAISERQFTNHGGKAVKITNVSTFPYTLQKEDNVVNIIGSGDATINLYNIDLTDFSSEIRIVDGRTDDIPYTLTLTPDVSDDIVELPAIVNDFRGGSITLLSNPNNRWSVL